MNWFGFKVGNWLPYFVALQAHRRITRPDTGSRGLGVLQIRSRHLLYVGSTDGRAHLCVAFVWLTRERP